MAIHPQAGNKVSKELLVNVPKLVSSYYLNEPDLEAHPEHCVAFGTSGHRGCSLNFKFNESHILAITQAICDYRKNNNIYGPLFLVKTLMRCRRPLLTRLLRFWLPTKCKLSHNKMMTTLQLQ